MTLREELEKRLEIDYSKAPKKFWNKNNLEMIWNEEEKLYIGIDSKGEEWIASLQNTSVPLYYVKCTNPQRKGNVEVDCGALQCISITNKDNITCRKCKKSFTAQLDIPKSSQAYQTWEKLQQEGQ